MLFVLEAYQWILMWIFNVWPWNSIACANRYKLACVTFSLNTQRRFKGSFFISTILGTSVAVYRGGLWRRKRLSNTLQPLLHAPLWRLLFSGKLLESKRVNLHRPGLHLLAARQRAWKRSERRFWGRRRFSEGGAALCLAVPLWGAHHGARSVQPGQAAFCRRSVAAQRCSPIA